MKNSAKRLTRQRAQTDARLAQLRPLALAAGRTRGGWVKTIRESLGLSAQQLASRLKISKQALLQLEANEVRRTVSLGSLDRAARALGARVAYAIVPDEPLEVMVDRRARAVAERKLKRVAHSMSLEEQMPPDDLSALQVTELAKDIKAKLGRELWEDP